MTRIYHMAKLIGQNGEVSPLCAVWPKPIDMRKATWTIDPSAVTCRRCRAALSKQARDKTARAEGEQHG